MNAPTPADYEKFTDNIRRAGSLARWLIEDQGKKRKVAYIISAKKYNLPRYDIVREAYHRIMKKQLELL